MTIRVTRKPADAYQHGNLREALVNAGLRLLNEGGVNNLSLRAAAQLAGVSHAAPYRHFKDKNALVAAIAEQGFGLLTAAMRDEAARVERSAANDEDKGFRARLMALGRGYLKFAITHPGYLGVIFAGVLADEHKTPSLQAAGDEAYRVLCDAMTEGVARGELTPGDPDLLSLAAWSMVHGLSQLIINHAIVPPKGGDAGVMALGDQLLALLGRGMFTTKAAVGGNRTSKI